LAKCPVSFVWDWNITKKRMDVRTLGILSTYGVGAENKIRSLYLMNLTNEILKQ